jgi:hypothetical protein
MRPLHFLLLACAALLLSACATAPRKGIVGKWQPVDSSSIDGIEFGADGAVKAWVLALDQPVSATYKFVDRQTIETDLDLALLKALDRPGGGQIIVPDWLMGGKATVKVSGQELRLAHSGNRKEQVLRRTD